MPAFALAKGSSGRFEDYFIHVKNSTAITVIAGIPMAILASLDLDLRIITFAINPMARDIMGKT